jgi:hypothetical protein
MTNHPPCAVNISLLLAYGEAGDRPDETDYPCSVERSKELDRIQRLLQEIIPEERRKWLGID